MSKPATEEQPTRGWQFRIGVLLFVLGGISPVFVPLVTALDVSPEWKAMLSGLLVLGIPELLWVAAAAILGKRGFDYIKGKIFGMFKRYAPPAVVSPMRYRIGLVLFVLPLLAGWLTPYVSHLLPAYEGNRFAIAFAGDLMLLTSLFVLGGDFWDKLRALFIRAAKARFPTSQSAADSST